MTTVFPPPPPVLAPVFTGDLFPVRRVFCVGRNYAAHAREMGADPNAEPPFFFTKWAEAVVPSGSTIAYPPGTEDFHYEAELVVALLGGGRDIPRERALDDVFGYAAGLDMTRRDLQADAKAHGRPWDLAKNFEQAAPLGPITPASEFGHPKAGAIRLTVNGQVKQDADLAEMIWPVADIIAFLSRSYSLQPGDLIYTGTPAGVGPVVPGDQVTAEVEGLHTVGVTIGPR